MMIIKKDGRKEPFQEGKLYVSLFLATHSNKRAKAMMKLACKNEFQSTEEIIAFCRSQLSKEEWEVYKQHKEQSCCLLTKATDVNESLNRFLHDDEKIMNENANKNSKVFNTQRDLLAGTLSRSEGLKKLPKEVAKAHMKGDLHFHDLDYSPMTAMTNCCLIDVEHMLKNGFSIGHAEVETPQSIETATAQIVQIIANVSSCQYGGCSINRIDEVLSVYAKKNYEKHYADARHWLNEDQFEAYAMEKTKKDIYDAMQSLEYEVNTLFTANGQTPFTSIGFGLGEDFFSREIQKAILNIRIEGLGKEKRTAIFPKLIFTIKKGVNLTAEDPNYDIKQLALTCATKRMYPDILNYDRLVELTGSFKVPMGCRSFLPGWHDENGQEVNEGRMNLGVVTLNLPRLALEAEGDQAIFYELLEEKLAIVKQALDYRIARCCEATPENAPILYMEGAFGHRLQKDEAVKQLFDHHRATVSLGYIGLYEVGTVFYGPNWEKNHEARAFTLDVLKTLYRHTQQWTETSDYYYSVYSTPSESLTDRFCQIDQALFGEIEHITDKGYYTNSFHYDIRKNPTPFEKLDFEKEYAPYTTGGFIHYCEYPVLEHNKKALEAVWDYSYDKVGYLGTNTPIDHCYECGYSGDFKPTSKGFKCPECGNENPETCDVVKRTCGYLGNPQARPMVYGRHQEICHRVKHM